MDPNTLLLAVLRTAAWTTNCLATQPLLVFHISNNALEHKPPLYLTKNHN
jgi:hypothetical protein